MKLTAQPSYLPYLPYLPYLERLATHAEEKTRSRVLTCTPFFRNL